MIRVVGAEPEPSRDARPRPKPSLLPDYSSPLWPIIGFLAGLLVSALIVWTGS